MDNPEASDSSLAMELFRTDNAIHCRRAHLAAKMHMQRPEISVDECAAMLLADQGQAKQFVEQWRSRKSTIDRFVTSRKRAAEETREEEPREPARGFRARTLPARNTPVVSMQSTEPKPMVEIICRAIREEEGRLSNLWNDVDMVPTLVKYYPGFRAYAEFNMNL